MTDYQQRVLGGLLGFFLVGPAVTVLIIVIAQLNFPGGVELFLGAVIGAFSGAVIAGRMASRARGTQRND